MAKKETQVFTANISLNKEKGGGWLAKVTVSKADGSVAHQEFSAWKNATAAKKWVKEQVKAHTPRKSISFIGADLNDKNKPQVLTGLLQYKVEV